MSLYIVQQEQIGLLYISEFRSSSKWEGGGGDGGGCLASTKGRVEVEGVPASPEPLSGPRSANAI